MSLPPMPQHRYRQIGILGKGRVARVMAVALAPYSAAPPLLHGRSDGALDGLVTHCDLVIIAVSDDAITPLVNDIARAMPHGAGVFAVHTSGRCGAGVLEPLRAKGALTAAVHPAMTFTGDAELERRRMIGTSFAVTGSSEAATIAAVEFVGLLGGIAVRVTEDSRALYHAGLCHASNHLVTLLAQASQALSAAGVEAPHALLGPLVRAALDNSLTHGINALSGPLLRGDGETLQRHLTTLAAHCPQVLPASRAMALATLDAIDRSDLHKSATDLRQHLI